MFQNLNSQITHGRAEPNPFVNRELPAMLRITQGHKREKESALPLTVAINIYRFSFISRRSISSKP